MMRTTEIIPVDKFSRMLEGDLKAVRGLVGKKESLFGFLFAAWQAAIAVTFFLTAPTLLATIIAYGGTALRQAVSW